MHRRILLRGLVIAGSGAFTRAPSWAAGPPAEPITLGIEGALHASGLGDRLRKVVGYELSLTVNLLPAPSLEVLDQLQAGTIDAALTQAPQREETLNAQGLTHNRKRVANGSHILVGPASDPAGVKGLQDPLAALDRIVQMGQQQPSLSGWVQQGEPNGTQELEATLWKALGPRPFGAWMHRAERGPWGALQRAAQLPGGGYTWVERGLWLATPKSPLKLMLEGHPRLITPCHIALPFRSRHPAAKLLAGWLATGTGQRAFLPFGKAYLPA